MKRIVTALLLGFAVEVVAGDFVDGFHKTSEILARTRRGPMLLAETSNSAIYVSCGIVQARESQWPTPTTNINSEATALLNRFAFSHLDKLTATQTWLMASGVFSDGGMAPQITDRRICGMTVDNAHLWLLLHDVAVRRLGMKSPGSPTPAPSGFLVLGFRIDTGMCDVRVAIPYQRSNRKMWGWDERTKENPTDMGTPDYLGDMSIRRIGDDLLVLGQTNSIEKLRNESSNNERVGTSP